MAYDADSSSKPKEKKIDDLNRCYDKADTCDKELFAEMRSNLLLSAGEHYSRRNKDYLYNRVRDANNLSDQQKLRITKNHIHKISSYYTSNIFGMSPSVSVAPKNQSEIQDQKAAELNQSVWQDAKQRYKLKAKFRSLCKDFVEIGECGLLLKWDPEGGEIVGYEEKVMIDPATGMALPPPIDPATGQPMAPEKDPTKPIFEGCFIWERLYGFNTLRPPEAKEIEEASYIIIRKMVDLDILKAKYKSEPDKMKFVNDSSQDEFVIFDSEKFSYDKSKNQVMVREHYYRPCHEYPEGYFYIVTQAGILEEGPLPGAIYPIITRNFLEYATSPRGRSIIKVARPYQAEINRASSAQAMAQITLGDDKLLYQAGSKVEAGIKLPGVRGISYQGAPPEVLPGRDGGQYAAYVLAQIDEMYKAVNLEEISMEKSLAMEPHSLLFLASSQKVKFAEYAEKFEEFQRDVAELYLKLARYYLPDSAVIWAVGRSEQVNLSEFRSTDPLRTIIKLEAQEETVETKIGRHLTLTHTLQYVGAQLDKKDIGRIIKAMPFANHEQAFDKLTQAEDNATNLILSLDRGEGPQAPMKYEDAQVVAEALTYRMRKPDYKFLAQEIQMAYDQTLDGYEQEGAKRIQDLKAAESEFIPVDGALVACDIYVPNSADPSKAAKRVRLPYNSLQWLIDMLEKQGQTQDALEQMNQGLVSDVLDRLQNAQQMPTNEQPQGSAQTGMSGSPVLTN